MSMALHSDAGFRTDDRIVGTLGIYTTHFNDGKLAAGTNRYASRDLADLFLTRLHRHPFHFQCRLDAPQHVEP